MAFLFWRNKRLDFVMVILYPYKLKCSHKQIEIQIVAAKITMALGLQYSLFPNLTVDFPSTRYQGSKAKLADWIWEQIAALSFVTCLDAFGGTGAVAYRLKKAGKQVTYNDLLRFNYYIGLFRALSSLHYQAALQSLSPQKSLRAIGGSGKIFRE
jgi:hypothetical protein